MAGRVPCCQAVRGWASGPGREPVVGPGLRRPGARLLAMRPQPVRGEGVRHAVRPPLHRYLSGRRPALRRGAELGLGAVPERDVMTELVGHDGPEPSPFPGCVRGPDVEPAIGPRHGRGTLDDGYPYRHGLSPVGRDGAIERSLRAGLQVAGAGIAWSVAGEGRLGPGGELRRRATVEGRRWSSSGRAGRTLSMPGPRRPRQHRRSGPTFPSCRRGAGRRSSRRARRTRRRPRHGGVAAWRPRQRPGRYR